MVPSVSVEYEALCGFTIFKCINTILGSVALQKWTTGWVWPVVCQLQSYKLICNVRAAGY